jgi:hypothetical protein
VGGEPEPETPKENCCQSDLGHDTRCLTNGSRIVVDEQRKFVMGLPTAMCRITQWAARRIQTGCTTTAKHALAPLPMLTSLSKTTILPK